MGSTPIGRASREVAQLGSVPGLGPGGCRFKSCLPDHLVSESLFNKDFFVLENGFGHVFSGLNYQFVAFLIH
jgi:hypothetical protein